ncbi:hypothetical protein ACFLQQ_00050 [Actinomycetota bacterium]
MADLTTEEINEAKRQLKGPRVVFWISLVLAVIGAIGSIVSFFTETLSVASWAGSGGVWSLLGLIFGLILAILWVILYWVELSGLIKGGKPYAVGLGRFLLIWMMIFTFPIGTIIGAVVWKRFSHPATQKYLNYKS